MMSWIRRIGFILGVMATLISAIGLGEAVADNAPFITVASTTSTQNAGLYDSVLPLFSAASGIDVRIVAVGTGQAIRQAQNGDADVLLVHHKTSEEKFVAEGYGLRRHDVMYNDFVLIGPSPDPAGIAGKGSNVVSALHAIADAQAAFASRGDDSGTNRKERKLWQQAGINPESVSGTWYRETGSSMGATLNAAVAMNAYVISDRATWLKFANKGDLRILVEGDEQLFNQYGIILVNPAVHPHVKREHGQTFVNWIIGEAGQRAIGAYRIEGQQAFFPNAD